MTKKEQLNGLIKWHSAEARGAINVFYHSRLKDRAGKAWDIFEQRTETANKIYHQRFAEIQNS